MNGGNRPVVLIPGFTGSRLTTRFQDNDSYDIWISLQAMYGPLPPSSGPPTQWWLDQMMLSADGMTPRENPDCNHSMSGLDAISILDPAQGTATHYFYELIERLFAIGYNESNLKAAAYDWRLPPVGLELCHNYFSDLKSSIEQLVEADPGNRAVTIIGHSLGNRITQYFLQKVLNDDPAGGQAWIDSHVARYLAVSALWLGVPKSIHESLADLGHLGIMPIPGVKPLYQSYGALPWMFPVTEAQYEYFNTESFAFLRDDSQPMTIIEALETGSANSTLGYRQSYYIDDLNYSSPAGAMGGLAVLPPPVAEVHVLYATGQETEVGAYYKTGLENTLVLDPGATSSDPNFLVQDGVRFEVQGTTRQRIDNTLNSGDGFLPYGSLAYYKIWQQDHPEIQLEGSAFPGRTHYNILQDDNFLDVVAALVSS
jgi:pimeloyl-ACP methyl ester carboxylesterase